MDSHAGFSLFPLQSDSTGGIRDAAASDLQMQPNEVQGQVEGFMSYRAPDPTVAAPVHRGVSAQELLGYFESSSDEDSDGSVREEAERRRKHEKHSSKHSKHRGKESSRPGKHKRDKEKSSRKKRHKHDEADKVRALERKHRRSTAMAGGGSSSLVGNSAADHGYYFDTHGDKDNLAFDSLYRGSMPVYRRWNVDGRGGLNRIRASDGAWMPSDAASVRYFAAPRARQERDSSACRTRFEARLRLGAGAGGGGSDDSNTCSLALPLPSVLPLDVGEYGTVGDSRAAEAVVESVEEYILRRTREFNEDTRAEPWNISLWLKYTAFQEQAVSLRQTRKLHLAEVAVAEKKLSILEKALQHAPSSERLLLAFMDAMAIMATQQQLLSRWQKLLARHGSIPGLWDRYLQLQRGNFSDFRVAGLQESFQEATKTLSEQAARFRREGAPKEEIEKVEEARVGFVLQTIQAWLQAGYTERALAGIQAVLEFAAFSPPFPPTLGLSEASRVREFRDFWESGAPRIGEEGASGWSSWVIKSLEREFGGAEAGQASVVNETERAPEAGAQPEEEAPGGWSMWRELAPTTELETPSEGENAAGEDEAARGEITDKQSSGEQDIEEQDEGEEEETEEELMARLGMKLEAGLGALGGDAEIGPEVIGRWVDEEANRSSQQWLPVRDSAMREHGDGEQLLDERQVELEDVSEILLPFDAGFEGIRERLALGCCMLLGAPLESDSPALCSNDRLFWQLASSSDTFGKSACEALTEVALDSQAVSGLLPPGMEWCSVSKAAPGSAWKVTGNSGTSWWEAEGGRAPFLRRLLRCLVTGPMSGQPELALALFRLGAGAADSSRAAQETLSERRGDLVLWGAFAKAEGEAGRIKSARKVFSMALASLPPNSSKAEAAPLALDWADLELQAWNGDIAEREMASAAALLPLLWLGGGLGGLGPAEAATNGLLSHPSLEEVRAARKGFQGILSKALMTNNGRLDHASASVVAAAALFEALVPREDPDSCASNIADGGLSPGLMAAAAIFQAARSSAEDSVRLTSRHHERLQIRFARLLCWPPQPAPIRGMQTVNRTPVARATPRAVKKHVSAALADYPSSPALLSAWAALHQRAHQLMSLRRSLVAITESSKPHHSTSANLPLVWVLLIQAEARRPGAKHAVRATLERCLSATSPLRSCPVLWRIYLSQCLRAGQLEAARKVFLRAIHECPWSKALWLDGFAGLRTHASPREIGELLDICREKEVLLRTDIFEVLLAGMDDE